MRLIEPVGLLHGEAAADAMQAGLARPLAGGPAAFSLARLIDDDDPPVLTPANAIPQVWHDALSRVTAAPPRWAGLPADRRLVMGILNVTPDSFSDPSRYFDPATAIAAGHAMAEAGADILDVGGESTRPGAAPVPPAEEQARILPVIRALAAAGHCVSADTRNSATMAAALDAGARIVNDVSALAHDPEAAKLLARRGCPVILMHMRGTPADMQRRTSYRDVAREVLAELAARADAARAAGIATADIAIDPGIGFAKDTAQNRELLYRMPLFTNLGYRIVIGVSRKSMIGRIGQEPALMRRLPGSLAAGLFGVCGGASILRVHDVAETVQALRLWQALADGVTTSSATVSGPERKD